jgi:hypothetical protein
MQKQARKCDGFGLRNENRQRPNVAARVSLSQKFAEKRRSTSCAAMELFDARS